MIIDYTYDCVSSNGTSCDDIVKESRGTVCQCSINFTLDEDFVGQVLMYYSLTNYYQNHRRYVKSLDYSQLRGDDVTYSDLDSNCEPFDGVVNGSEKFAYAPCGAIANSMFNDTLSLSYINQSGSSLAISMNNTGIAWSTDVNSKFGNPPVNGKARNSSIPPPSWHKSVWQLNGNSSENNGYENEDLMVWMRTAALPSFRKLYRRVNHDGLFKNGLPAGNYTLHISYAYPVTDFGGKKRMILSTTSWLGGKNPFLGLAYIITGAVCLVMGCVFLFIHIRIGKKTKKHRPAELSQTTPYYDSTLTVSAVSLQRTQ
jgi:hypothetical protein